MRLKTIFSGLAKKTLDSQCRVCAVWCAGLVCHDCLWIYGQTVPRCKRCAMRQSPWANACPHCEWRPDGVDTCVAVVSYAYPWRDLVASFKYHNDLALAPWMAGLALGRPEVQHALAAADLVLPMPLSQQRLAQRGYNQAHEWARQMASGKLMGTGVLRLPTDTPQAGLDKAERLAQLDALRLAFVVHPEQVASLQGQNILLVDDVQTTGTTLHALAQVLRHAGAREVNALVFARAEVA